MRQTRRWFVRALAMAPLVGAPWRARARAFEVPDAASRAAAIGSLDGVPEAWRPAFTEGPDDAPIPAPRADDWLAQHEESGQSFARFRRQRRHKPTSERGTIAVVPLGALAAGTPLAAVKDFAARFFGMPVVQRLTQPIDRFGAKTRVHGGRKQYHTKGLLDALVSRVPEEAYCMIAVTQADLYPDPDWNFVFGEARFFQRAGVYSFARYDPAFHGEAAGPDTEKLVLRRCLKLMVHEVGHMFSIEHCVYFACVMNGSNHLEETDRSPLHACPLCLRKLQDSIGFDVAERERRLGEFFRAHGLEPEAAAAERRLARLTAAG